MFSCWAGAPHRATRDLDLLGFGEYTPAAFADVFREISQVDVEPDAMTFDATTLTSAPIRADFLHGGIRVTMLSLIGRTRIPIQVDVGFGDDVIPAPEIVSVPTLLDFPQPVLRGYAKETVIAEKLHAMVSHGMTNTRMKDFFDIHWLSEKFAFDESVLRRAINNTFEKRGTRPPTHPPIGLTAEFYDDSKKVRQWTAFTERIAEPRTPFNHVVTSVARFLLPLLIESEQSRRWQPRGPWLSIGSD